MSMDQQQDIVTAMLEALLEVFGAAAPDGDKIKALERKLRLEWGGQAVYVKKVAVNVVERRRAIRERYDMTNRRELQAEFGISRGQFYKDLRAAERLHAGDDAAPSLQFP